MECEVCGTERRWLHKHHKQPKSQGGTDDPANIMHICANCHEDIHGGPCGGTLRDGRLGNTPKAIAKKSATMKRKWQDPEYVAKLANRGRGAWSPERRAAHSAAILAWQEANPEAYAEQKRKLSESKRKRDRE